MADYDVIKKAVVGSVAIIGGTSLLTAGLATAPITGSVGLMAFGYTSIGAIWGGAVGGKPSNHLYCIHE